MTIRVCEAMNAPVGRLSDRTVCEANGGVLPRQVLIDADGCPVVDLTLQIAKQFDVPVIILCDTSHQIEREGAQTLVFDIPCGKISRLDMMICSVPMHRTAMKVQ